MKNYYEILEVNPKASNEIIKKVYKIKIKQNHPDLFQGEEKIKAEEITKEITEAYDTLQDNKKRAEYDFELENEISNSKNLKYESLIESLKSENNYLKNILNSKNKIISSLMDYSDIQKSDNFSNDEEEKVLNCQSDFNNLNSQTQNNKTYLSSIFFDLKQVGFKILGLLFMLLALILFFNIITGHNIFYFFYKMF